MDSRRRAKHSIVTKPDKASTVAQTTKRIERVSITIPRNFFIKREQKEIEEIERIDTKYVTSVYVYFD